MRLAADVGGTKSLVALVQANQVLAQQRYENHPWPNLETLLLHFWHTQGSPPLLDACVAAAGPVVDNVCILSNRVWTVDGSQIGAALGGIPVRVINDFTAVGYGLSCLQEVDLYWLQRGLPEPRGAVAFLGAGTGLGQGYALWHQDHYRVYAAEGGHVDFAPRTPREWALRQYLLESQGLERVSVERVVSGLGIPKIYRFLAATDPQLGRYFDPALAEDGAGISAAGDPLSVGAMEVFVQAYGAVAGNLALTLLPRGGLYIAGGIAPQILPLLQRLGFLEAFLDKGRMRALLSQIPVAVVCNPQVGLLGAAFYPEPIGESGLG
ncbi:MAG: glucokinase [Thermostichales cyanobacterium SZTDM-1c_bins_54]